MNIFSNLKNDINAGISSAIVALPFSVGIGLAAVAPLGPEYFYIGALAGLYSALFTTIIPPLCGASRFNFSAASVAGAAILSSFAHSALSNPAILELAGGNMKEVDNIVLSAIFFCSALVGLIQVLIAQLKLVNLITIIPKTVFAGVINAVAIIIILNQIPNLLGLPAGKSLKDFLFHGAAISIWDVIIGATTIISILLGRKFFNKIPPFLTGVICGSLVYVLILYFIEAEPMITVIGALPCKLPAPDRFISAINFVCRDAFYILLPDIIVNAVAISVVSAVITLISASMADSMSGSFHNPISEIRGLGSANLISAFFGGVPCGGSPIRIQANYLAGGRTKMSHIVSALVILVCVGGLGPLFAYIPFSVMAGVLLTLAANMFDDWTKTLFAKIVNAKDNSLRVAFLYNISITATVTLGMIFIDLLSALLIGLMIEFIRFMLNANKTLVRQEFKGSAFNSNTARSLDEMETLKNKGDSIIILKLQGPLFFANTDLLANKIEFLLESAEVIILDMKRIVEIDGSGTIILNKVDVRVKNKGKLLFFSYLPEDGEIRTMLRAMGLAQPEKEGRIFTDTNTALAEAEDIIISRKTKTRLKMEEIAPKDTVVLQNFTPEEIDILQLERREYKKNDRVITQGEEPDGLYFLVKGKVSIIRAAADDMPEVRLVDFGPGVCVGEMAVLGGGKRTADVYASQDSVLYFMRLEIFESVFKKHPDLTARIVANIAKSLASRLAVSSEKIQLLETS